MSSKHRQLANFITTHRKALGLSMNQLAKKVGVTRSNVHYWESGEVLPQPWVLQSLARELKVSYEDLFTLAGYAQPEGLPSVGPYTRVKFGLNEEGAAEAERLFARLEDRFGKRGRRKRKGRQR